MSNDIYLLNKICSGGDITREDLCTPDLEVHPVKYLYDGSEPRFCNKKKNRKIKMLFGKGYKNE